MDLADLWKVTLAQIEVKLDSPAQFKTWFKDTILIDIKGRDAEIGVKNSYTSDWLKKRHNKLIKSTISYVYGKELEPKFIIDRSLANLPTEKVTPERIIKETPILGLTESGLDPTLAHLLRKAGLNESYTFVNYVVGSSNKLAHAAAMGVAQKTGTTYNPLFIYGKTGLGKTHLGQAIGRHVLENDLSKKVLYTPSEGFLNEMVKALKSGKNLEFRQRFRTLDVLIIDDIQFMADWQDTKKELFNTFNVLHNDNKQMVFISDRAPDQIKNLDERLKSRFYGGMIVDIGRPDYEMRLAILDKKSHRLGINLPTYILEFLAKAFTDNIRELEGSLQKISLYTSMHPTGELTIEEVARILGKDTKSRREQIKVPKILRYVAKEFNLTVKELKGPRRTAELAFARQICMFILREEFGYKLEQIAGFLERKDHTTVLHAVDKIKSKLMVDEGFRQQFDSLKETISTNSEE